MEIRDLMIGNYVMYNENGTIFKVISIDEKGLGVANEIETTWIGLDQFSPIPITEDILLKCGFTYLEEEKYWQNPEMAMPYVITAKFGIFMSCTLTTYKKDWTLAKFNCLHELQILYKSLTKKDLIINF